MTYPSAQAPENHSPWARPPQAIESQPYSVQPVAIPSHHYPVLPAQGYHNALPVPAQPGNLEHRNVTERGSNKPNVNKYFLIGGAAITAIGVGAAALFGISKASNNTEPRSNDVGTSQSAESQLSLPGDLNGDHFVSHEEYDQMSPEEYASLDEQSRVEDSAKNFNVYLHTAYDAIKDDLTIEEAAVLDMPDLTKPRADWTDQDYSNYESLALKLVTSQGSNTDEGERALAVVMNPELNIDDFSRISAHIRNNLGARKSIYEVQDNPLSGRELTSTIVGDIVIDQNGGRIVAHKLVGGTNTNYSVYANRSDKDGNIVTIRQKTYESLNHPELQALIDSQS